MKKLLLFSVFFCAVATAWGQSTYFVTNVGDSGPGSFRQTVAQAFPNDTIKFNVRGTIFLVSGQISIPKNLIIQGPGMDSLRIVQMSAGQRVLEVITNNFELTGLTLYGGNSNFEEGLGLYFDGVDIYLKDVRVDSCIKGSTFNSNTFGFTAGGGIKIIAQQAVLEDCIISNNDFDSRKSTRGGGAYLEVTDAVIRNCLFDDNGTWTNNSGKSSTGGGLYLKFTNRALVENTTFTNSYSITTGNTGAPANGAGLYAESGQRIDLRNCTFSSNVTLSSTASLGGGLYVNNVDSLYLNQCRINGNFSRERGRLGIGSGAYLAALHNVVEETEIANNGDGVGAIYMRNNTRFENNHIHNNTEGGAIVRGDIHLSKCLFNNNAGTALIMEGIGSNNAIVNNTFYQNSADEGGAITAINNTNRINIINCTMVDNSSTLSNGALAIYVENNTVYLKNNIITNTVFSSKPLVVLGTSGLILSGGGNILRDNSISMFLPLTNDRNATDPRMGTFALHGGQLSSFDLQASSPAINLGGADTLTVDQRGFPRDNSIDAGAFEFGAVAPGTPTVTVGVTALTVCENTPSQLVVTGSGAAPLQYQWLLNGTPIGGATNDTLSIPNTTLADAGIYTCQVFNAVDTTVSDSITLMVNAVSTGTDVQTSCNSYTWIDGITYTSSNNTATVTLTNATGCDSVVTLNLTINTVNTAVTQATTTLTATTTGATYQWVDCNSNYAPVAGATARSFTPTLNGDYAVVITENGCTDTSACFNVIVIGVEPLRTAPTVQLYPNPVEAHLTIDMGRLTQQVTLRLYAPTGTLVKEQDYPTLQQTQWALDPALPAGVYWISIQVEQQQPIYRKVVKQ